MAVTLPTFADVGIGDPRSVGSQPAYPQNDPVAEAENVLGKGIEKAGGTLVDAAAYSQLARNRMDRASAQADFLRRIIPITEQLKTENDPEKITALRGQYQQAADTAGQAIGDPDARELWVKQQSQHVATGEAHADLRGKEVYFDQWRAGSDAQAADIVRQAAATGDPAIIPAAAKSLSELYSASHGAGALTAEQAFKSNDGQQKALYAGIANSLINKGRPDDALALIDKNPTAFDPNMAEVLRHRAETRGSAIRVDGVVNGLIGGVPGGGRAEGNPGSLAMAAASVDPAIETAVAKKIATTSGLQHWAGIDPDTGKPWNPELRSAFEAAGLPTDGPISDEQWKQADPLILKHESMGGQNVPNYRFDATHTAGGPHQITNSTWKEFGGPELMAGKGSVAARPLAVGDSIAAQLIRNTDGVVGKEYGKQAKPDSTATVGANPQQILGAINAMPDLGGQDVVLSTGLSNAPDQAQLATVADQIKTLKAKGAGNVTVLGLGNRADVAPLNEPLAKLAADNGATFAGPLRKVQSDGIHSSDAKDLLLQVQAVGKAQPIPTGPQSAPAAAQAAATGQNRTGLPLPSEVTAQIMSDPRLRNDQERYQALQRYETQYRMQEATLAQQERIQQQRAQQQMRDAENKIFANVYDTDPNTAKITPQQVAVDPAFNSNPERRKAMIELINNPPGSGVPAAQSYNAALSLVERIRLPEGDPNKITTEDQVYPLMRTMNRTDFDYVRKTLNDIRGPGGERLAQTEERFFKDISPYIDKSNPLAGTMDPAGKARLYEYRRWVDGKKDELKAAGKNPDDLFNPASPAYIGKPEIVSYYQPTLQQSMRSLEDFAKGVPSPLAPLAPWNPPPIPEPFSAAGKREGETTEQYLKRTGQ